jgi:cyclopropane-fatty-acyl-phospholipid synthase
MEKVVSKLNVQDFPIKKRVIFNLLSKVQLGLLQVTDENGNVFQLGNGYEPSAEIEITDARFYEKCFYYGDVGFGEAYVEGYYETPDIAALISFLIINKDSIGVQSGSRLKNVVVNILGKANRLTHLFNKNSREGAKKNISFHYDLSNVFYSKMLDPSMTYSCALWSLDDSSLEKAQMAKYQQLCEDLDLKVGEHILEVGCGWGGFAEYAAKNYKVKITGLTISKEQLKYASDRIEKAGLSHLVDLKFCDYRDVEGSFDKAVSIEMIEAVGDEQMDIYFKSILSKLKPGGRFVVQAITSPDARYKEFKKGVDFIQKHIFPGSLLPSLERMNTAARKNGEYQLFKLFDMGLDYARTLNVWHVRFNESLAEVKDLGFNETFIRKWNYYLKYCEAAFATRNISVVQATYRTPN